MCLQNLFTPESVDAFIETQICDDQPKLLAMAKSGNYTHCQRKQDMKLDALCNALERRQQLVDEIQAGIRLPTGDLFHHPC